MTANTYPDWADREYLDRKRLIEMAAEFERLAELHRARIAESDQAPGNRAERRRQAAQNRKAKQ